MIIRRYGNRFHSVVLDFDPAAMTEVGFRKDGEKEWTADDFMAQYEMVREEEIIAEAKNHVQERAERTMLEILEQKFNDIYAALEEGQHLGIESKPGVDYPRTRYNRSSTGHMNFTYTLDRPLRLGVWQTKNS